MSQNLENRPKFGKWAKIWKLGKNLENQQKKVGNFFENWSKFGKLVKIWKSGKNFEKW